jgi:prevent-host-death family protein
MKHAKVSELKARLSSYLAEVRNGETIVVCDRGTPIARIVRVDERVEALHIERAARPVGTLRAIRGVRLKKKANVVKLLRESRDQR